NRKSRLTHTFGAAHGPPTQSTVGQLRGATGAPPAADIPVPAAPLSPATPVAPPPPTVPGKPVPPAPVAPAVPGAPAPAAPVPAVPVAPARPGPVAVTGGPFGDAGGVIVTCGFDGAVSVACEGGPPTPPPPVVPGTPSSEVF